jgi:hypothetical protein
MDAIPPRAGGWHVAYSRKGASVAV